MTKHAKIDNQAHRAQSLRTPLAWWAVRAAAAPVAVTVPLTVAITIAGCDNKQPYCGNGVVEAGEGCDDGNRIDDDRCTNSCLADSMDSMGPLTYVKASNTGTGDEFGYNVALSADGSTLAVSAYREASAATGVNADQADNSALEAGAVYLFARSATAWILEAYVKASDTHAGDHFGFSIALSADGATLAVGANYALSHTGAVYVFTRSGATWSQEARLMASNAEARDSFGTKVALSAAGAMLAVSAPGESSAATGVGGDQADNSCDSSGAVYVFTRSGATWSQDAYIKASNTDKVDFFGGDHRNVELGGVALSADGSTLVVGAFGEDSAATGVNGDQGNTPSGGNSGAAYVFTRSGMTWRQDAYLKASNTDSVASFGSVALSADGSTLAVGAISEASAATGVGGNQADNSASGAGAVYVFVRSGATWIQEAYVKASNTGNGDGFGYGLALSADGSILAVGATKEDSAATGIDGNQKDNFDENAGAVYVFDRRGTAWSQRAYIKASNTGREDRFGYGIALSADGAFLVVGAPYEDSAAIGVGGNQTDNAAPNSGAIYVLQLQ